MAKREPCEFGCGKTHYTEKARVKCMERKDKETCTCDDYWASRWHSHQPEKCPLRGTLRKTLRVVETKTKSGTSESRPIKRKGN